MPTRRIQTSCPNCRTPQMIEAQQVFDVQAEPGVKQRVLSGAPNLLQCANCGYQGPVHMPLVYHDAEKELLLTFVPQELGLPMQEQERIVGPMITKIVEGLPAEKRKAYLLQPRTMLTFQTMIDTILEADGISKEDIEGQQARVALLQRLANLTTDEAIQEVAQQEDEIVDREFFQILSTLVNNAAASGDEALARRLIEVQNKILPVTSYGQEVQKQNAELQAAAKELEELGEQITRKDLLDLVVRTPNDIRLRMYVSMARGGMDYEFFQMLSERIDRARPDARPRLSELRTKLLELTQQYDAAMAQRQAQVKQLIEALMEEDQPEAVLQQTPDLVDELFLGVLQAEMEAAQSSGDIERGGKLRRIAEAVQQLSAPPPEFEVINRLIEAQDDDARNAVLDALDEEQLAAVLEMMMGVMPNVEAGEDRMIAESLQRAYRLALRKSMRRKMAGA